MSKSTPLSASKSRFIPLVGAALLAIFALVLVIHPVRSVQAVSPGVVISQVYGGGGNAGATFKNDFIELFNRGASPVNVTGWTVQYAATGGTTWTNITALSGTIPAGGYYLVQEAAGAGGTTNLPAPDASGGIAMAAGAG
ncbi:MAG: uncharacterized protein QOF72_1736, partial [Blastocatellia bacterium]|nr:uncharacterized protein [Blastocatellia bacterium]